MTRLVSAIPVANKIPFATACRYAGMEDVPVPKATGSRAFCPFGELSHPDEGKERALRVYHDHGYCFAESLYLSPVRIFALMHDLDEETAATELLVLDGHQPVSYDQLWDNVVSWTPSPDLGDLASALRTWLSRTYPDWNNIQYDPFVADALARCLGLISHVRTEHDAGSWLQMSKTVMSQYLRRTALWMRP